MRIDLMHGTLDMLILKALTTGSMHGYGVARWLERATGDGLRVEEGSLYPALHRLTERGWVRSEWGTSEHNRRARYYMLTARGRKRLEQEVSSWTRFSDVVAQVLRSRTA